MRRTLEVRALAIAAADRWLAIVLPQIGADATFAQVDVDTLFTPGSLIQKVLVGQSIAIFEHIIADAAVSERALFVEMSIPLEHRGRSRRVKPFSSAAKVLARADFTGDLRGRQVPGFYVGEHVPEFERGAVFQTLTPLRGPSVTAGDAHLLEETPVDVARARVGRHATRRAVVLRHYPPMPEFREAVFDAPG